MEEATHVEFDVDPRYWEDAMIDGAVDAEGSLIPGRVGESWRIKVRLSDGRVEGWPAGVSAAVHYKVCDAGLYWLLDAADMRVAAWAGSYVPAGFLGPGGDYVVCRIGGDGFVADWRTPSIDSSRWRLI